MLENNSFFSVQGDWAKQPTGIITVLLSWFYFSIKENFFLSAFNSWALLHLAMVKLILYNVKNFFPIAGLEFSGKFGIWKLMLINILNYHQLFHLWPYHLECTQSCLISEAKRGRAWLVLGWETINFFFTKSMWKSMWC